MKFVYAVFLLVFLASCTHSQAPKSDVTSELETKTATEATVEEVNQALNELEVTEITIEENPEPAVVVEEIIDDINDAVEEVEQAQKEITEVSSEPKVVKLQTTYQNPKTNVIMDISLSLDDNEKITSISVTSNNYDGLGKFNSSAQSLIGKTIEEASEVYLSGGSLTAPAFQKALKDSLK